MPKADNFVMLKKLKRFLFLILAGIFLFALGFVFAWYKDRPQLAELAKWQAAIQTEQTSCATFINGGSGDFSRFAYCQQFANWVKGVQNK